MSKQIEQQKAEISELQEQELRLIGVREKLSRFIDALESIDAEPVFNPTAWNCFIERVLIKQKSLIFEFKNGENVEIKI